MIGLAALAFVSFSSCSDDKPTEPAKKVPTVTTAAIIAITDTTAQSGGTITSDGGATVTARGVCWSTNETPTVADDKTSDGAGAGTFVSSITGLTFGTLYYVRAYATNSAGTGYGMTMAFTSSSISPLLVTSDISAITSSTAQCGGSIISDGGATVTARGVCWSTNETPTVADNKTTDGTGTGSFTSSITGLSFNTTYHVRAYATNAAGTGYGETTAFKTAPVPPTVLTSTVDSLTSSTAMCGGYVTADGGAPVTVRGVCWSTNENPTIADDFTEDGSGIGAFSSSLIGLNANTSYFVRAYATNSAGTNYGQAQSFRTNPLFPIGLSADNGLYYRGSLNSANLEPELILTAADSLGLRANESVYLSLVNGDGIIGTNPILTDAQGQVRPSFSFNGAVGYAVMRALWPFKDSLDLLLRASVIAPGEVTQGQYIMRGDSYANVRGFNGAPFADIPDPSFYLNYLDYEAALGVVVIIADTNQNSTSQDFEPVYGIILNTIYSGTSLGGWGIGDLVTTLVTEYGAATNVEYDPTPPAAWRYDWPALGLTAYTTTEVAEASRTVFEVHLTEPSIGVQIRRAGQILK